MADARTLLHLFRVFLQWERPIPSDSRDNRVNARLLHRQRIHSLLTAWRAQGCSFSSGPVYLASLLKASRAATL